jgi:hypothetical protein
MHNLIPNLKWHRQMKAHSSLNDNWIIVPSYDSDWNPTGKWMLCWFGHYCGRKLRGVKLGGPNGRDVADGLTLREAKALAARLNHHNVVLAGE